jgi:uncharacterized protein YukE
VTFVTVNPLVAASVDGPKDAWSGVWIAEDIELIIQGVKNGSWVDGTLGVVGAGLDALAMISDPVGVLLQYGVSWIIEHVKPLSEALDWLAGDPAQISAQAQTWRNVAGDLRTDVDNLVRATKWEISEWTGAAADAYRTWATQQQQALEGLAKGAEAMAAITEGAGFLIAAVRILVRDAIATLVSRLIVYAAEELASFGLATPLVVEQVTTLCASWAAKIARWLKGLLASLRALAKESKVLEKLIEGLKKILAKLRGKGDGDGLLHREPADSISKNGAKVLMTKANVAAIADKYGVDLKGVNIVINKTRDGVAGITGPTGVVYLNRAAFRSEEELARTLEHERFHVQQIRNGERYPEPGENTDPWENPAKAHEREWWANHPLNRPEGE